MNLRYLEYAVAVNKTQSINKAASELMLSQPYLSGCLKNLEKELGYPIFLRTHNGVHLTEKGTAFMHCAQNILSEFEKMKRLAADEEECPLKIASAPLSEVMRIFLDFKRSSAEKLSDTLTEYIYDGLYESVSSGENRIGIVLCTSGSEAEMAKLLSHYGLRSREIVSAMPYFIAVSEQHPFAEKETVTLEDLTAHPLVCYTPPDLEQYLHWTGLPFLPPDSLLVHDRGQFFDALNSGGFYSIIIKWDRSIHKNLRYLPLTCSKASSSLHYICQKDVRLTGREKSFLKYLKEQLFGE